MNGATAACWTLILLSALFCETVMSKGGRGGAGRGGAGRGGARSSRARFKAPRRYGSSSVRVAAAAAAGAAAGMAAGGWYASSRYRSDAGSDRLVSDGQSGNRTGGDFYSARRSGFARSHASLPTLLATLGSVRLLTHFGL